MRARPRDTETKRMQIGRERERECERERAKTQTSRTMQNTKAHAQTSNLPILIYNDIHPYTDRSPHTCEYIHIYIYIYIACST